MQQPSMMQGNPMMQQPSMQQQQQRMQMQMQQMMGMSPQQVPFSIFSFFFRLGLEYLTSPLTSQHRFTATPSADVPRHEPHANSAGDDAAAIHANAADATTADAADADADGNARDDASTGHDDGTILALPSTLSPVCFPPLSRDATRHSTTVLHPNPGTILFFPTCVVFNSLPPPPPCTSVVLPLPAIISHLSGALCSPLSIFPRVISRSKISVLTPLCTLLVGASRGWGWG